MDICLHSNRTTRSQFLIKTNHGLVWLVFCFLFWFFFLLKKESCINSTRSQHIPKQAGMDARRKKKGSTARLQMLLAVGRCCV